MVSSERPLNSWPLELQGIYVLYVYYASNMQAYPRWLKKTKKLLGKYKPMKEAASVLKKVDGETVICNGTIRTKKSPKKNTSKKTVFLQLWYIYPPEV